MEGVEHRLRITITKAIMCIGRKQMYLQLKMRIKSYELQDIMKTLFGVFILWIKRNAL